MLVVSNTSPILNLAIIDRLSLIREQFTTVIIPKGVLEELRVGERAYQVPKKSLKPWMQNGCKLKKSKTLQCCAF
jgi:predicted nucleic acid-binding protein